MVFTIEDDKAIINAVSIDYTVKGLVKLEGGLQEGDLLITSGMFKLRDQTKVRMVNSVMIDNPKQSLIRRAT